VASRNERRIQVRGIVIRARALGEADRVMTLFTEEHGKIEAIAAGIRRSGSRLSGLFELGNELTVDLHRGRSWNRVVGATLIAGEWIRLIRPEVYPVATQMLESIDLMCELDLAQPDVFLLLRDALTALPFHADPRHLLPRFFLRLLILLGIAPLCDRCIDCGIPLIEEQAFAETEREGLLCRHCASTDRAEDRLRAEDLANLQALGRPRNSKERVAVFAAPRVAHIIEGWMHLHLGRRLRSEHIGEEIQQMLKTADNQEA